MSTTVYGTAQYDDAEGFYTRVGCTYDITSTDDSKTFSGTLFWQHKGPAKTDNPYMPTAIRARLHDDSVFMEGQTVAVTNGLKNIAKHTNWTTMESKSFSVTYNCLSYARQIKVTGSVYDWFPGNDLEILIDMPPLPSWDVIYDGNGGTNVPSAQAKYKDIDLVLSSSKPSRADYIFYHWNTQPNNSGTTYNSGDTYTTNSALNLYAIWNSKISYNGNGTYISTYSDFPTQTKTYGTNLTLHSATPTRTGYVFNGWNTAADGSGTAFQPGGTYSAEVSVTLYAQWLSLPAKPVISSMTAVRWNESTDSQDDEGTSAKITADWAIDTGSDYYGNSNTGTVSLVLTPQSGSSSHVITPVSGTSGTSGTAVFMVSGLDTDMQYNCTVTVTDLNASSNRTVILTRAFFIMDFKAGGQGIGIGRAAPNFGLEVGYETIFDQDVTVYEDLIVSGNVVSPKMTGTPTAPTPSSGDDSTKVATTAFVKNAIGGGGSSHGIPSGGSDGQILTKQSGTDYDVDWEDPSSVESTDIPTANNIAKFDSDAHMNSEDMTSQEVDDFVDGLNVTGFDVVEDISDKFTFTSAWSNLARSAYKIGKLVVFSLEGNASTVVAGAQYTMVTIASGYRPKTTTYYTGHGTNVSYFPQGIVNSIVWTSGDITVRPQTNTCNYIFLSGMYVLP